MYTIKINNKIVLVPSDAIIEYLKYRKLKNTPYFFGMEDILDLHIQNIMKSFDDIQSFKEIENELEKIAIDLI